MQGRCRPYRWNIEQNMCLRDGMVQNPLKPAKIPPAIAAPAACQGNGVAAGKPWPLDCELPLGLLGEPEIDGPPMRPPPPCTLRDETALGTSVAVGT